MSILAGLQKPFDGKVTFICSKSGQALDVARFRQRCSFIFQQFYLLPELDVMHNVSLPLTIKGDSKALTKSLVWLDKVGLAYVARVSVITRDIDLAKQVDRCVKLAATSEASSA